MIEFKFEIEDLDDLKLYSVNEVARATSLAPRTVYRAIEDGSLPAVRLRSALRIPAQGLSEWLTASAAAPPTVRRQPKGRPAVHRGYLRPLMEESR